MIEVRKCKYGRGVFATETIPKGTIIEVSPLLTFSKKEAKLIAKTTLQLYVYDFGKNRLSLALGVGSLFNHKTYNNVTYNTLRRKKVIEYRTTKKVRKGSQLFINYGYTMRDVRKWLNMIK